MNDKIYEKDDYGFTLTIPKFKNLCIDSFKGKKLFKFFSRMNKFEQEKYLNDVMKKSFDINSYIFERKDNILNIHGIMRNCYYNDVYSNIQQFYNIVGIKKFDKYCNVNSLNNFIE